MVTNLTATTRRRVAQIAAVGAVALVLGTAVVSPAEAMKRRDATVDANMAIDYCFNAGGDADSYEYGGAIYVSCTYEDGSVTTLRFVY